MKSLHWRQGRCQWIIGTRNRNIDWYKSHRTPTTPKSLKTLLAIFHFCLYSLFDFVNSFIKISASKICTLRTCLAARIFWVWLEPTTQNSSARSGLPFRMASLNLNCSEEEGSDVSMFFFLPAVLGGALGSWTGYDWGRSKENNGL